MAFLLPSLVAVAALLSLTSHPAAGGRILGEVPAPFNLTITSYNFNTTLHWQYRGVEDGAYFTVEILKKGEKRWTVIELCRNILQYTCDLSSVKLEPLDYYKARVKANVGDKKSNYTTTEFSLVNVGIIGPPSVNGSIEGKTILIDIWHPHVPSIHGRKTVGDYAPFHYIIFYGNTTQETENCDEEACSADILIRDQLYCFYVQGKSNQDLPMTTEKSQNICITNEEKESSSQMAVVIVLSVFGALLLLFFLGYLIYRSITKDKNKMPQSLNSVVRNIASRIHMLPQHSQMYDNVSTSPIETHVEQKTFVEEELGNADTSAQSISCGSAYPPYQSSLAENDLKTEERVEEANSSNSYSHNICSSGDSSNSLEQKKEESITRQEPEPSRDVRTVPNSFGYDKPHFP